MMGITVGLPPGRAACPESLVLGVSAPILQGFAQGEPPFRGSWE